MSALAPTLQTTYAGVRSASGTTKLSSITIGAGSGQLLVVIGSNTSTTISTPTWNGSSTGMTLASSKLSGTGNITAIWYLKAPTQTTADLQIASTSTGNIQAYLFNSVDQTTPIGANTGNDATTSASHSVTFTTDRNNSIIVSGIEVEATSPSVSATGTNQTLGDTTSGGATCQADSTQTTTTLGSYTQTFSTPNVRCAMISIEVHGTVTVDNTLAMGQGSIVLSGQTLGLTKAMNILMTRGLYTLSGQIMGFGRKMVLAVGTYTLTGKGLLFRLVQWLRPNRSSTPWVDSSKSSSVTTNSTKNAASWSNQIKN